MKRVMLTVAYEGTAYCGWQIQSNGNTVEGELNKALTQLLGEKIMVSGASRTDTGVHALCNLAVFDTSARMPAEKISYALNQRLPEDIRIQKSEEVATDFHPRKCATKKTYVYRIYEAVFPNPIMRQYSHFTYTKLDVTAMKKAADHLVGEHDFKSFCSAGTKVESTVRTLYAVALTEFPCADGRMIELRVTGNGFLYNMVRIITGTLLEVGRGKLDPQCIPDILAAKDRGAAGPTAPACGLMLEKYELIGKA
ncbi:MAG: tRNA pseudouridine(38-40) synthase TruA [Lachnospiraceae bacterium]|nr:tRNA pseudouridine(38-40) synthase TruA [Lachnospiraceae bacterium]